LSQYKGGDLKKIFVPGKRIVDRRKKKKKKMVKNRILLGAKREDTVQELDRWWVTKEGKGSQDSTWGGKAEKGPLCKL